MAHKQSGTKAVHGLPVRDLPLRVGLTDIITEDVIRSVMDGDLFREHSEATRQAKIAALNAAVEHRQRARVKAWQAPRPRFWVVQ
jgi:hypothetical protein